MRVIATGTGPICQAPLPNGPAAEVLVDEQAGGGQLATAHVVIPLGGRMPEHAHGESTALIVPLSGELVIASGERQERVSQVSSPSSARGAGFAWRTRPHSRSPCSPCSSPPASPAYWPAGPPHD